MPHPIPPAVLGKAAGSRGRICFWCNAARHDTEGKRAAWQARWVRSIRSVTVAMSTTKRRGCIISEVGITIAIGADLLTRI